MGSQAFLAIALGVAVPVAIWILPPEPFREWVKARWRRIWSKPRQAETPGEVPMDERAAVALLVMHFKNTARLGSELFLHHYTHSLCNVGLECAQKRSMTVDPNLFSLTQAWWLCAVQRDLVSAAMSKDKKVWLQMVSHADDFNIKLHDVWGPILKAGAGLDSVKGAIRIYDQTFGEIGKSVEILKSLGWKVDWKRRGTPGA